jgi:hypothetical protein
MVAPGRYGGQLIAGLQQMRRGEVGRLGAVVQLAQITRNTCDPAITYPRFPVSPVARSYAPIVYGTLSPIYREDPGQNDDVYQREPPPKEAFLAPTTGRRFRLPPLANDGRGSYAIKNTLCEARGLLKVVP